MNKYRFRIEFTIYTEEHMEDTMAILKRWCPRWMRNLRPSWCIINDGEQVDDIKANPNYHSAYTR